MVRAEKALTIHICILSFLLMKSSELFFCRSRIYNFLFLFYYFCLVRLFFYFFLF